MGLDGIHGRIRDGLDRLRLAELALPFLIP